MARPPNLRQERQICLANASRNLDEKRQLSLDAKTAKPMLRNYITTALRHFRKYRGYTAINLAGLTAGLSCTMLIALWVADELAVDQFHDKGDRTWQLLRNMHLSDGQVITTTGIPQPVKQLLESSYPEVESATLVGWEMERLFRRGTQVFKEKGRYVSPTFLTMFSFQVIAGDARTALNDIHSLMISRTLAEKYFGSPQASIDQVIRVDDSQEFTVTGVFEDAGPASSLTFDWLMPDQEFISRNDWVESWYNGGFSILCTLKPGADVNAFAGRVEQEINTHTNHEADERLIIQKFTDRYLHATFEQGVNTGGRIDYVKILVIVALFTLITACVNFMNLSTAQASRRAKEMGMRKIMGAQRGALSAQLLTESSVLALAATLVSILVVVLLLPWFNTLTGKEIDIDPGSPLLWLGIAVVSITTGLLSGAYPALSLSRLATFQVAKGLRQTSTGTFMRKGLVVIQFGISMLLIVGTLAVYRQINYIMSRNVGIDRSNVMMIQTEGDLGNHFRTYKEELLKIPGVQAVTSASGNPLSYGRSSSSPTWEGKDPQQEVEINIMMVDHDFLAAMKATVVQGRDFRNSRADSTAYIINEQAARVMGFANPVGKALSVWGRRGEIVGVVANFHMSSLYEPIAPLIMRYDPASAQTALVRVSGDNMAAVIESIRTLTLSLNPSFPFAYEFLDDVFAAEYKSEQVVSTLVSTFALMTIFISCLGLLGLCSFSAEQRKRELGIRRVHGASRMGLAALMSSEYARLILLAFTIFIPLAWYLSDQWLERFAFRTELGAADMLTAAVILCGIAGATVWFKSFQAASANPIETLKEH
jgi:putative ABC transport system permease protein